MKVEIDSLKCAKLLLNRGFNTIQAEGLVETFTMTDIRNLRSKEESDSMLTSAMRETLDRAQREFDKRHQEFDKRLETYEKRAAAELAETRAAWRWLAGIIITVGVALAGYLSALIHYTH